MEPQKQQISNAILCNYVLIIFRVTPEVAPKILSENMDVLHLNQNSCSKIYKIMCFIPHFFLVVTPASLNIFPWDNPPEFWKWAE